MDFREQIEKKLNELELDKKQLCQFAWLCGVRALPFLSTEKDFAYWPMNIRQDYLYSVFNALDNCVRNTFPNDSITRTHIYSNADVAANAAYIARPDVANAYAKAAAYAVRVAANALDHGAAYAADALARAVTTYAIARATNVAEAVTPFEDLLFKDIEAIKLNRLDECEHGTGVYGILWGNFLKDLTTIDCAYWAELYENLFNNGFDKLDEEELKLRLDVPDEIKAQGAAAVAKHIKVLKEQGEAGVQKARLILIGSAAAGKTTLARRLQDENAPLVGYDSTHGVDRNIELDINGVLTQIWDFGGQVIYHASHRCFMSERCIYVLVVNARRNDDYKDIGKIKYWLDTVKDYAKGNAKVFIVINEEDDRKYNFDDVSDSLKTEYKDLIQDFYAFNVGSNDKESLRNFKAILSEYIEVRGGQKIGAHDKRALDDIKYMFESGTKLLNKETVLETLDKYDIEDKERVLDLFDTLGVALHYDDFDDFIIDPGWITHGIYKVIDYMQNPEFKQPVYEYQFKEIFKDESGDYPEDKLKNIFELMAHYKIGFRNSGVEGLFVPCVAAFYKPSGTTKPDSDNYIVKFNRNELKEFPTSFFDKFMAENAKDMNKRDGTIEFWQTGMVLINNKTNAFVEVVENREIVITVWGRQKEQYADKLIGRFDELLKEFNYVAIGKEEKDIITGKQRKVFAIFPENDKLIDKIIKTVTALTLGGKVVEGSQTIIPYVVNGIDKLQNIFIQIFK